METPRNHHQETPQSSEKPTGHITMPSDHPEKKGLFSSISDALRDLGSAAQKLFATENSEKGVSAFQEFMANMLAAFHGEDLETGITIHTAEDLQKAREIFRPIIDLDETSIEFQEGDFIRYNAELGTVDFYPVDKNQESGHALAPTGVIPVRTRPTPPPNPDDIPVRARPTQKGETEVSQRLWDYLIKRWPHKSWPDSCGRAVRHLLTDFGIKPSPQGHGKDWYHLMKNDSRFVEVPVSSLSEIPDGGIMTYSGKWMLNGKPNGSEMNQKYGHVEVKAPDNRYYSFYASSNPGGSAKEPQLHNNFTAWKQATGFTGVFVPVSKVKA